MRSCHYIKKNHKSETPRKAAWLSLDIAPIDPNSLPVRYEMVSGTLICGYRHSKTGEWITKTYVLHDANTFWQIIEVFAKKQTRTYLICNNSNDTLTLLDVLTDAPVRGWKVSQAVLQCPPCIVKMRRGTATIAILDIQNIWPTQSYATSIGASLQPNNARIDADVPLPKGKPSEIACLDMKKLMVDWWSFLHDNDLGGFSPTSGTQSMRVWRHKFMTHPVLIDLHTDALKLARDGLYGGRVECFRVGSFCGELTMLDVNSSYPYIMANMRVPTKLRGYSERITLEELTEWIGQYEFVCDVTLQTDESCYPLRRDGVLVFPIGRFRTVLCGTELRYAVTRGHIKAIHRTACYEAQPAFSAYMQFLWAERKRCAAKGDAQGVARFKLLMNSFFGKWAQKGGYWENVGPAENNDIRHWLDYYVDTDVLTEYRSVGGLEQRRNIEQESSESSPAIAACVTAGGRMLMYEFLGACGRDHAYYMDTDSILVDAVGRGRLDYGIRRGELGGLKVQSVHRSVQIYSAKHTRRDGKPYFSGVGAGAVFTDARSILQHQRSCIQTQIVQGTRLGVSSAEARKAFKDKRYSGLVGTDGRVRQMEVNEC